MPYTDWLITASERGNPDTRIDDRFPGEVAWSEGNHVRALVHGATYFAELYERLEATREGDLVLFTDWQGDADEQLVGEPGSEVVEVLGRADQRGVDVRGLIWRSHWERLNFNAEENRLLGRQLQARGAQALLDMRVRTGGSHHQKLLVIRHRDRPERDIAYVGGIDLCHSRRDDSRHLGDPQPFTISREYGDTPPWHDVQAAITGPVVHELETVFRERWEDPTALTRNPLRFVQDKLLGLEMAPDPLPPQAPPPPSPAESPHVVQVLRTYPALGGGRAHPFARRGERSVARGYTKAIARVRELIYIEDQYLWGGHVGDLLADALRANPGLHVIAVVPQYSDEEGLLGRTPQDLGRERAMRQMEAVAPDRVALYGIENHRGTPVYVHAKVCVMDDLWTSIGSDNFNRRSWTHDSEVSAVVLEPGGDHSPFARRLRLSLAAEHLDRLGEVATASGASPPGASLAGDSSGEAGAGPQPEDPLDPGALLEVMADCIPAAGMFAAFAESARRLDDWYDGGCVGPRPPGRLRRLRHPGLHPLLRGAVMLPYRLLHDPDGRPRPLRWRGRF